MTQPRGKSTKPIFVESGTINYSENNQESMLIPRTNPIQGLIIHCSITIKKKDNTELNSLGALAYIESLQVVGDGSKYIKDYTMHTLLKDNLIFFDDNKIMSESSTDTEITYNYDLNLAFAMPQMVRPNDSILHPQAFEQLELRVKFANNSTIGTNVEIVKGTFNFTTLALLHYFRNPSKEIPTSGIGQFQVKEHYSKHSILADNSNQSFFMPNRTNYKQIIILAFNDGMYTDDVINNIKMKADTELLYDIKAENLRTLNLLSFDKATKENLVGCYIIDFCPNGKLSTVMNLKSHYQELEIALDIKKQSGDTKIMFLYQTTVQV